MEYVRETKSRLREVQVYCQQHRDEFELAAVGVGLATIAYVVTRRGPFKRFTARNLPAKFPSTYLRGVIVKAPNSLGVLHFYHTPIMRSIFLVPELNRKITLGKDTLPLQLAGVELASSPATTAALETKLQDRRRVFVKLVEGPQHEGEPLPALIWHQNLKNVNRFVVFNGLGLCHDSDLNVPGKLALQRDLASFWKRLERAEEWAKRRRLGYWQQARAQQRPSKLYELVWENLSYLSKRSLRWMRSTFSN